jgi:cyclopropane fatty-acyl-phospholipid synthase-like methyltransferase
MTKDFKQQTEKIRTYYDGPAANLYREMWQDNMHMGTWEKGDEDVYTAMDRTNEVLGERAGFTKDTYVLDAGCGYGKTARYFAKKYGCKIVGITIGQEELDLARERAKKEGLDHLVDFQYGDFQDMKFEDNTFDVVFSQEAFLHGDDQGRIINECYRVLKPGGRLIFTDILVKKGIPDEDRDTIYARIQSTNIFDGEDYVNAMKQAGFTDVQHESWNEKPAPTYNAILNRIKDNKDALVKQAGPEFVDKQIKAYEFWVKAAREGKVGQGLFVAQKPQ